MSTTTWPGATPRRADNVELARYRREVRVGRVLLVVLAIVNYLFPALHYDGADRAAEK